MQICPEQLQNCQFDHNLTIKIYVASTTCNFVILAHKMLLLKGAVKPAHCPSSFLGTFGGWIR
jgi:hypothetical protein